MCVSHKIYTNWLQWGSAPICIKKIVIVDISDNWLNKRPVCLSHDIHKLAAMRKCSHLYKKIVIVDISDNWLNKRPVGLSSFVNCPPVVASFLTLRQLGVHARWHHMDWVPHPNYVDPMLGKQCGFSFLEASSPVQKTPLSYQKSI